MQITKTVFPKTMPKEINVAAYARVSSGKDAMHHSLSAQVSKYSQMIQSHPGWHYIGVYADEAITGTMDVRSDFQRLLTDCRAGKIDMVITKSVSRFARNTVVLLETARELKALGIDIYFEEQNIHTISAEGELMLTILAGFAEEESLSVSENMRWRIRKNFQEGIPWNGTVLGYRLKDGKFEIEPKEADVVKRIFREFLSGKGGMQIAKELNEDNIPTRFGNEWHCGTVLAILKNEVYTGNLLLQKTYRPDHRCKRKKNNDGQYPKYAVSDSHEAIISQADFDAVQLEFEKRHEKYGNQKQRNTYPLSGKVVCGLCGKNYRRVKSRDQFKWMCSTYRDKGVSFCHSKQVPEDVLLKLADEFGGTEQIKTITVNPGNNLIFTLQDGSQQIRHWQDRSRRESWTDEMRKTASERSKGYGNSNRNTGNN